MCICGNLNFHILNIHFKGKTLFALSDHIRAGCLVLLPREETETETTTMKPFCMTAHGVIEFINCTCLTLPIIFIVQQWKQSLTQLFTMRMSFKCHVTLLN